MNSTPLTTREELIAAVRTIEVGPFGPNSMAILNRGGFTRLTPSEAEQVADVVQPILAAAVAGRDAENERLREMLRCESSHSDEEQVWCHLDKGHDTHHVAEGGYVWPSDIFNALVQRDESLAVLGAVAALAAQHEDYCCSKGCTGRGLCIGGWQQGADKCVEGCTCTSAPYLAVLAPAQGDGAPPSASVDILGVIETVKTTGGSVEILGVKIEPCDEYGRTLADRIDADEQSIDAMEVSYPSAPAQPAEGVGGDDN